VNTGAGGDPRGQGASGCSPRDAPGRSVLDELRAIDTAVALRALAHPIRLALLEVLESYGPMTATQAAERLGEKTVTCSFHFRQLAKYGLVEEVPDRKGRARPWRIAAAGFRLIGQPAAGHEPRGGDKVTRMLQDRWLENYQRWLAKSGDFPAVWREAVGMSEFLLHLTPDEAAGLGRDLVTFVLERYEDHLGARSEGRLGTLPVELLLIAYPLLPDSRKE
jgi:DNA-binding transcriptional ArsR family regulator